MIYTIKSIVRGVTSTGKTKATVALMDSEGNLQENVTIWNNYPNYATLSVGSTTEGEVTIKQNGQFTNKTLNPAFTNTLGIKRGGNIAQAQATKREDIAHAQDRKEESIKEAAIFRDATLLTTAYSSRLEGIISKEEIKQTWVEFRKWLKGEQELPFY